MWVFIIHIIHENNGIYSYQSSNFEKKHVNMGESKVMSTYSYQAK